MNEIENMTYEQAFSRLEEVSAAMGEATVPLDKLMAYYEEGMALAAHCDKLLKSYEARLEKVSKLVVERELEGGEEPEDESAEAPF